MKKNPATYAGRVVVTLFGLGLLFLSIELGILSSWDFQTISCFGALIGLCLGYGIGGDLWGARLFDLFAHTRVRDHAEEPLSPAFEKTARILGVIIAGFLVLAFLFIMTVLLTRK